MSVLTNYLYIASLKHLDCTVVTAIFATNASFVYLLSWVILHQQFVGIRWSRHLIFSAKHNWYSDLSHNTVLCISG